MTSPPWPADPPAGTGRGGGHQGEQAQSPARRGGGHQGDQGQSPARRGGGHQGDQGPYADVDTIDEADGPLPGGQSGPGRPGGAAGHAVPGSGLAGGGLAGGGLAGDGPPGAGAASGAGGAPAPPQDAGAGWAGTAGQPPRSGGALLAWLWGEQGLAGEYLLARRSMAIGRDPGSDIVLSDPTVRPEHARIAYENGQWWLRPVDSAGRTWVNGRPVAPGQRMAVTNGDRLRFGFHTQLRLLVPSAR